MPVDPLVTLTQLATMETTPGTGRAWQRSVAAFEDELAERLTERFEGVRLPVGGPDGGADIALVKGDGAVLAVDVKAIQYGGGFSKLLRNRMQELLATSVTMRREFPFSGALLGIIGIVSPPSSKWSDAIEGSATTPLGRLVGMTQQILLRDSDGVGFDHVAIGLAAEDGEWLVLDPENERRAVPAFSAVMDEIAAASSGLSERQGDLLPRRRRSGSTRILLVGDEWSSSHGGLSTVNRELAVALAARGADVTVDVPAASSDDRDAASGVNVNLVSPLPVPGLTPRELLCTRPVTVPADYYPDVVIGHGRVLGPHAEALRGQFYPNAKRVHIVHTDAESLEAAKETPGGPSRMSLSDDRRELETELAITADLVVGVGPLLTGAIEHSMRGRGRPMPKVIELTPGLRDWGEVIDPEDPPQRNQVLVLARAEDPVSKGLDIAALAVVEASTLLGTSPSVRPTLVVRGVPAGEEADKVKYYLVSCAVN
ncbi:glycosyltransferase family 4 protein [Mycobacterium sp. SMC-16]|uniref:glycosyltransferase family 4 protein n=1 Tax=Mycobacterium sp. SMC-16 TaxID=3385967 RepID=UPI00390C7A6F